MIERVIKYAIPLSALFLLPACSQEDVPGAGPRPMEFVVSISAPSQSRVSETADATVWTDGDIVILNVTQGGNTTPAYGIIKNGELTDISPKLFWDASGIATITAYFSNIEDKENNPKNSVKFADQSSGLAYVLRASETVKNGSTVNLTFTHQLAKVRVVVTGNKASEVDAVSVYNYSSCSVDDTGAVTGSTPGYIKMRQNENVFEANVVPATEIPENFISFGDDFEVAVSGITSLEAGKVYTITIDATSGASSSVETTIGGHPAVLMRDGDDPLYFATMNIGADKPEDIGAYFWWGDVVGYIPNQYITGDVTFTPMGVGTSTISFSSSNSDILTYKKSIDDLVSGSWVETESPNNLLPSKDAASVNWGGNWRMPTADDRLWLFNNSDSSTTISWIIETNSGYQYLGGDNTILVRVTESASTPITWSNYTTTDPLPGDATTELYTNESNQVIPGVFVKSKSTGGVVFLPQGGNASVSKLLRIDSYVAYWTSTPYEYTTTDACYIVCQNNGLSPQSRTDRYFGLPIRPVMNK